MGFLRKIRRSLFGDKNISTHKMLARFFEKIVPMTTEHELVRIGGDGDGGYLVPNDFEGIDACFSPGVADSADFEEQLTRKNIKCFLADFSVDAPPIDNELFDFEKKYLGVADEDHFITLSSWVHDKYKGNNDLIFQMDIEGAEYDVISSTPSAEFKRFRIIVAEFHSLDRLKETKFLSKVNGVFDKLLENFEIVHIHPNNCLDPVNVQGFSIPPVVEMTFLRKDRITQKTVTELFPHILDRTNVSSREDFPLPDCWYAKK